jgi:type VI secretion system protein ImpL
VNRIRQIFAGSPLGIAIGLFALVATVSAVVFVFVPLDTIRASANTINSSWTMLAATLGLPSTALLFVLFRDRVSSKFFDIFYRMSDRVGDAFGDSDGGERSGQDVDGSEATAPWQNTQSLAASFKDGLGVLKKRRGAGRFGERWLYQLPWYLLIGPPGSGKTTAITNSGLSFPLAERRTRYAATYSPNRDDLNWCFTDEAVLLDSAGRFTTQDKNPARDNGDWLTLLRLLKRHRRRQPLNGLVVAVAVDDLISGDEETRFKSATLVRRRVGELYRHLGSRVPIYLLFTKSDLLAGFSEYFDDLGREGRDAVLGMTFQPKASDKLGDPDSGVGDVEMFPLEFDLLVQRLEERMLQRMQHETDIQRRARAFSLPQQLMSMKEALTQFLYDAFAPNTFDDPVILRGTYFVSGTQSGIPLDAVGDAVTRTFHVETATAPMADGGKSGYFLSKLFREVIFLESWLVEKDGRLARRMKRLHVATLSIIGVAALTLAVMSHIDYLRHDAILTKASVTIANVEKKAVALRLDKITSGDLRPVAPLLNDLRALRKEVEETPRLWGWIEPAFLSRMVTLESETKQAYVRALNGILLPRLIHRVETQLAGHSSNSTFLYAGLHVYLMLGGDGAFVPQTVREWMVLDWSTQYTLPADEALRGLLADHLDAMLKEPLTKIDLDAALIERTRTELRKTPVAQRVFNGIVSSPEARSLPVFNIALHAGPSAGEILQMRSGEPLASSIPGLFTREGFFSVYLPLLDREADLAVKRNWILTDAKQRQPVAIPAMLEQVKADATGIYLQEFSFKWDQLINGISVKPITTLDESLRALNVLSAPTSPIRLLVATAALQTSLEPPEKSEKETTSLAGAEAGALSLNLAPLFPVTGVANTPQGVAHRHTAEHFRALQQLVRIPPNSGPNAQAPIDGAITELGGLYRALTAIPENAASPFDRSLPNALALQRLPAAAANLPDPIRQWFSTVVKESSNVSIGNAKTKLAEQWREGPGKFCDTVTDQRYPFVKNSRQDIPVADFARLFAHQGATDTFFTKSVEPFTNAARGEDGTGASIDQAAIKQFDRAAVIRDAMFKSSNTEPSVDFELSVVSMSPSIANIALDIHGQRLLAAPGDRAQMKFKWPFSEQKDMAALTVFPADGGTPIQHKATGAWALFRLMGISSMRNERRSGELVATFNINGYQVVLSIQGDRIATLLNGTLLSQFRCPDAF